MSDNRKASGRRRFINRILRKRLASTTSSLSQYTSDGTSERELARESLDSDAIMDDEVNSVYDNGYGDDIHDTALEHTDVFSNESVEQFAAKNEKVDFPGSSDDDMPWSGLTYEALVFPKLMRISRRSNKSPRVLNNMFLAQELRGTANLDTSTVESDSGGDDSDQPMNPHEVLVMEFSQDGKYLAAAGRDCRITVWQVISLPLSRLQYKNTEAEKPQDDKQVFRPAPVFHLLPVCVFEGHTATVLSLAWSKNNFLVSGSMDRTVRLWNVERSECLETFAHDDFVTAVAFHPNDDRFFISGLLDNVVRLWLILEAEVAYSSNLGDEVLITAVLFTPGGNYVIVGGFNGSLFALETSGLHVVHRVEVRENSLPHPFHHKHNNKITGIRIFENKAAVDVPATQLLKWNILVTTNDSKVRLIDLRKRKLVTRFKGSTNTSLSIVASLSDDNRYIISGSEDHWCYVWENNNAIINNRLRVAMKDAYVEGSRHMSEKHRKMTKAIHDSTLWKKLNMQKFMDDVDGLTHVANENSLYSALHAHHSKVNVALFAPDATKKLLEYSDDVIYDLVKRAPALSKAGMTLSKHCRLIFPKSSGLDSGHIIVTCDTSGLIRVFRQDSAYYVRKCLVEYRKSFKNTRSETDTLSVLSGNRKLDLSGLNIKLMKTRSLSPALDRQSLLKSKFHSKLLPAGRSTSNSMSMALPKLLSFKTLVSEPTLAGSTVLSSSSQVNLRESSKVIPRTLDHYENYMTVPFHDDDNHSLSGESAEFPAETSTPRSAADVHIVRKGRSRRSSSSSTDQPYGSIPSIVESGLQHV